MHPDLSYEHGLWEKGAVCAGMDEVGRGPLAGPVVAGIVGFAPMSLYEVSSAKKIVIRDSKKMTHLQRRRSFEWIKEHALFWETGEASVAEINETGIKKASFSAFFRALSAADQRRNLCIEYLLIDGFYVPEMGKKNSGAKVSHNNKRDKSVDIKQIPIKKGDAKSISIAAASIVAKVYRDSLMQKLSQNESYSRYAWHKNKGYGTKEHRDAIAAHGVTKHHRLQFVKTVLDKTNKK